MTRSCNRFEISAKMLHGFQRDHAFRGRFDAEAPELLKIQQLLGDCGYQDVDTFNPNYRSGSETAL